MAQLRGHENVAQIIPGYTNPICWNYTTVASEGIISGKYRDLSPDNRLHRLRILILLILNAKRLSAHKDYHVS